MGKKRLSSSRPKARIDWPSATALQLISALKALGFENFKVKGSHYYFRIPGSQILDYIQVPYHGNKEFRPEIVKDYWRQAKKQKAITEGEFLAALK